MIWNDTLSGHHLEYLHHIYMAALGQEANFVFVLPDDFIEKRRMMDWPCSSNISFDYMSKEEIESLGGSYLLSSYHRSRCLKKYALKHNANKIWLNTLCLPYPLLPLLLQKKIRVSGIIYQIYLYKWKRMPIPLKIKYIIETWCMVKFKCTKHLLILNDKSAAKYLNKLYKTNKCLSVVDPIAGQLDIPSCNRKKYNIPENDIVFFHFGSMDIRKGTLVYLNSLLLLTVEQLKNKTFIFAGKIQKSIQTEFLEITAQLKQKGANLIIFNEFCEYSLLDKLCYLSDYVVIPYQYTELSSGVVGYAAKFGKRLIGPSDGVIGKLIRQNSGSIGIKDLNAEKLAKQITSVQPYSSQRNIWYIEKNSIEKFQERVIQCLLQ